MTENNGRRVDSLLDLALARFPELSADGAERSLFESASTGTLLNLRENGPEQEVPEDSQNWGEDALSGCKTSSPYAVATCLTGEGMIFFPLPFGLSGWVITAKTSWPCSISAFSAGTENSGVPMKTIFGRTGNLFLVRSST